MEDGTPMNGWRCPGLTLWPLVLLCSCGRPSQHLDLRADSGEPPEDTATGPSLRVSAATLDFGAVAVGDEREKFLVLHNVGDVARSLSAIEILEMDAPFSVSNLDTLLIPAGDELSIGLVFGPTASGPANASVLITCDDPQQPSLSADLNGEGVAPVLEVQPATVALGPLWIGCSASQRLVLYNAGNDGMLVDSVTFDGAGGELAFTLAEEVNGPLPWSLGEDRTLELGVVSFAPQDERADAAYLIVGSSDDRVADARIPVSGTAEAWGVQVDAFTAPSASLDVVLALDRSGSMDPYLPALQEHLPELVSALAAHGVDLQLAVVVTDDGCVQGEVGWVEEDTSRSQAAAAMTEMMVFSGTGVDQERAFELLEAALDPSALVSGGCNQGLLRTGTALHLVGISDEPEQSPGGWSTHLATLQALRSEPVVLHAIAGTDDGSCGQAYAGFADAVDATGGAMVSLCTEAWASELDRLAGAMAETPGEPVLIGPYRLSATPVESTLEVHVDGSRVTSGWAFSSVDGGIVFEANAAPASGTAIEVRYTALPPDCEPGPGG